MPMLLAAENPRFVEEARRATGRARFARQRSSVSTERSVEPLSTTATRAGRGSAAISDSRQIMVSAWPFQFTTTTPTAVEVTEALRLGGSSRTAHDHEVLRVWADPTPGPIAGDQLVHSQLGRLDQCDKVLLLIGDR